MAVLMSFSPFMGELKAMSMANNMALIEEPERENIFSNEDEVRKYCELNYLDDPWVNPDNSVTAWCEYTSETLTIGRMKP